MSIDTLLLKKKDIITSLKQLQDREKTLQREIDAITHEVDRSHVMVATLRPREEFERVQQSIKRYLGNAMQLGMHTGEWVLPWDKPGVVIDVPEYITKLCTAYKVTVPS